MKASIWLSLFFAAWFIQIGILYYVSQALHKLEAKFENL